jgi:hypothetical protein
MPNVTSRYAAEGSCAHELADACSRTGIDPDIYLGATRTADGFDFVVDDEMVEGVRLYLEAGKALYDPEQGDKLYTERKFDLSMLYPGLYGTNDRVIWKPTQRRLIVDDFKYGAGIPVEVKLNKQLMYYALGAVKTLNLPVMEIELRIIQPRCPHPDGPVRSYLMNALDLLDFQTDLVLFAQATQKKDAALKAGDHCRFCLAAAVCPELAKKATQAAAMVFDVVPPADAPLGTPNLIDHAKLAEALKMVPILKAWCENVDSLAYRQSEAGNVIPGFKLVEKRATRKWIDAAAAELALKKAGLGETEMYPLPELRSPAQIEEVLVTKKLKPKARGELLAPLVHKVSSGHALAPDTDKRPAVTRQTAEDAFANV